MVDPIQSQGALAAARTEAPRSAKEWIDEALSWASPDGVLLHELQPIAAAALRRSQVGAGTEWGASLQRVLDDPRSVAAFQGGVREGVFNGAKGLLEGVWTLAKGAASAAYNENPLGTGLDALRHAGIDVPGWAPSAERFEAPIRAAGEGIGRYLSDVAHGRANVGDDIKGWIGAHWNELKADHARAAAQGGAAEARWWGQIAGRATFEIAAVAVPVTKFATVAKAAEAVNAAVKGGTLGEVLAQAARVGKLGDLFAAATKAGKLPELVAEARTAGRLPELVAAARRATGGLQAVAGKGGLTVEEIGTLEKAGTLSKTEAHAARVAEVLTRRSADVDAAAARTGLGRQKIADILATDPASRPAAASYLPADYVTKELALYDQGAVRFTSRASLAQRGTLGPTPGFVFPYREFTQLVREAHGDLAVVERRLGLSPGYLQSSDTMVVKIERADINRLTLPSGAERGANEFWLPGGATSGGVHEAVLDLPKGTSYTELQFRGAK